MSTHGRRVVGIAIATMLTVSLGGSAVIASAVNVPTDVHSELAPAGQTDALVEDAAVAADQGLDYAVTLGRSRAQGRLSLAIEALSKTFEDSFGGFHWGNGVSLVAQFKGRVPAGAAAILDTIGLPVTIESVAYSDAELNRLVDQVYESLGELSGHAGVGLDPVSQTIIVTANITGAHAAEQPEEIAARLEQETGARVRVEFTDLPLRTDLTAYGGGELWRDFMNRPCTTGFGVITAGGVTGVATAAHCRLGLPEPSSFYDDPWLTGNHDITLQLWHDGPWGDVAYYTTSSSEGGLFYYGNTSTKRDVVSVKSTFTVGDPLSWYGRKTGTTKTGSVWVTNYTDVNGRGHLTCVVQKTAQVGDSGGPVFNGSAAAGFISELAPIDGDLRMCFSRAMYIDEALGSTFIRI